MVYNFIFIILVKFEMFDNVNRWLESGVIEIYMWLVGVG